MKKYFSLLVALTTLVAAAAEAPLKIISIDVEGGAATLYVTPQGHSVLIDTGWPTSSGTPRSVAPGAAPRPPRPPSAPQIVAAAKAAGVTRLDYLIISHYHVDHVGGVHELMAMMPIGTFVDHGPNREETPADIAPGRVATMPAALYPPYVAAIASRKHIVLKAGQNLKVDDLVLTAVSSDGQPIAKPVAGAGSVGVDCAKATSKEVTSDQENPYSVGILAQWGKARILALADLTWSAENALVCPINRIGHVGLMFADNHGSDIANSPTLLNSVQPTVVLMNNGSTKGADGAVLDRVTAVTGPQGLWQLHFATRTPDKNAPADQIANLDGPDTMASITVTVDKRGSFTLTNSRNGFSRAYGK
jgi:beta-lactamase superfamily II metal-dependent hydrolase